MPKQTAKKRNGFTLIEVMIALAILAIGLTGLAAMQLSAMQFSHSSHYRSMASAIALDIEERLWLELADNDLDCVTSDWAGKVTALASSWIEEPDADDVLTLRIPGLEFAPSDPDPNPPVGNVVRIPIIMSWTEKRFEDTDQTDQESFNYSIQIQCTTA